MLAAVLRTTADTDLDAARTGGVIGQVIES